MFLFDKGTPCRDYLGVLVNDYNDQNRRCSAMLLEQYKVGADRIPQIPPVLLTPCRGDYNKSGYNDQTEQRGTHLFSPKLASEGTSAFVGKHFSFLLIVA